MNSIYAVKIVNLKKEFHLSNRSKLKDFIINRTVTSSNKMLALDNLSLDVEKGDFMGLIGLNGAGKSTLLKMISNIYVPTSGNIQVVGSVSPFLELRVGFQPELKAKDNLYLYAALLGMNRSTTQKRFDKIVKFAGTEGIMDQQFKHLSTGMQVRLSFAITVYANSDILLIDEALAVGDISFQQQCVIKMKSLNNQGKTILFVSHDLSLIQKLCKKTAWIENGKIKMFGRTKEVIRKYTDTY